jgi:hypothetical protein
MYITIRLIIGCIFLVCAITAIQKSPIIRKRIFYIGFAIMSVILTAALTFLPFENLFVTFDSPKAAYAYLNPGASNIELVVEGDTCDFIVDRKNTSDTYLMIPKTADGWKIGNGARTNRVIQKVADGIVIYVYQYKNTSDYFITIFDTNGSELTVSDALNTKFHSLEKSNDLLEQTFVTYYAHIPNLNPHYSIVVNDSTILLA